MRKRISIDQLKAGLKVERLDRSWLATPFLRHRFTITSGEQIEQLHASGVQQLDVDVYDDCQESGLLVPAMPVGPDASQPVPPSLETAPSTIPFAGELPAARQVYRVAKLISQQAMDDVRMGRALNMEAVSEVVGRMADRAAGRAGHGRNRPSPIQSSRPRSRGAASPSEAGNCVDP